MNTLGYILCFIIGITNAVNLRAIGGKDVINKNHRYMAAILYKDEFFCTGVLGDRRIIITTKFCATPIKQDIQTNGNSYQVLIKGYGADYGHTMKNVVNVHINNETGFAVLVLDSKVKGIRPVSLFSGKGNELPKHGRLLGWGLSDPNAAPIFGNSHRLQSVKVSIHGAAQCETKFPELYSSTYICAGGPDSNGIGKGACSYDEGAPLIVNRRALYGLVVKSSCGKEADLYISVPKVLEWLQSYVSLGIIDNNAIQGVGEGYCRDSNGSEGVQLVVCNNPLNLKLPCNFEACTKKCFENEACKAYEYKIKSEYGITDGRCELHFNDMTHTVPPTDEHDRAVCVALPDREESETCGFSAIGTGFCRIAPENPGTFEIACGINNQCSLPVCKSLCSRNDKCKAIEYESTKDSAEGICELHFETPTETEADNDALCLIYKGCYDY